METVILSMNVKGLGNKQKRNQVFEWLRNKKFALYLLQETHSTKSIVESWEREWKGQAYFSGTKSNSEGVAILINDTLPVKILNYKEIIPGRLQALTLEINEQSLTIINIYGPNKDDTLLFKTLAKFLQDTNENILIGGDFNTVLDTNLDKKNGRADTHKHCRDNLNKIIDENNLIDVWRMHNPNKCQFTWHSNGKPTIFSRLDFFLITDTLCNITKNCIIQTGYKTDHSSVILKMNFISQKRGPGYFKINNSLLLNTEYKSLIKNTSQEVLNNNKHSNANTKWELVKGNIRNVTIKFASQKKKEDNQQEKELIQEIEALEQNLIRKDNIDTKELSNKKMLLDNLRDKKINGILLRSKAIYVESNEKNSAFFANLEKKTRREDIIETNKV